MVRTGAYRLLVEHRYWRGACIVCSAEGVVEAVPKQTIVRRDTVLE